MVGFGSDNSRGTFDNLAVQVLPPEITFIGTEEFADTHSIIDMAAVTGQWESDNVRYVGTPVNGDPAVSLLDLAGLEDGLKVSSILGLGTTLNTAETAGVVFDYYDGGSNFKFATINAETDELIIGHYTTKGGWVADEVVSTAIEEGADYELEVSLKGTTVNASVKRADDPDPGYQAMAGHVFNAVTVDGGFGLLARDGTGSFDNVSVKTNDTALSDGVLDHEKLDPIVAESVSRWSVALDLDDAAVTELSSTNFVITDLPDASLGMVMGDTVYIDVNGAGYEWFIDATPEDDAEFTVQDGALVADPASDAYADMDLLTVVMHEMGHILGYGDLDPAVDADDVMTETLGAGERHTIDSTQLVVMDADAETFESFLMAETQEREWLLNFLAEEDDEDNPNSDIAVVMPAPDSGEEEDSVLDSQEMPTVTATDPQPDSSAAPDDKVKGKKK
jgi:hypothetical protein